MNFLAHIALSGEIPLVKIGNFIGDAVRKKDYSDFPNEIVKGIQLHRQIDTYTDKHPTTLAYKKLISPYFGKYASVVTDIYFDHYLAIHWDKFGNGQNLTDYTSNFYQILESNTQYIPENVQEYLPYMIKNNWLLNYQFEDGLKRVFNGMSRRASFKSNMEKGPEILFKYYKEGDAFFKDFYPQLSDYITSKL